MTDELKQQIRERMGLRVRTLREMNGWTQDELARRAGVSRGNINRIEGCKYAANDDTLQAIAEAFGMTLDIVDKRLQDLAPLKTL